MFLCNIPKLLLVSDKTIHGALSTPKPLKTKPIREFSNFHYLPANYKRAVIQFHMRVMFFPPFGHKQPFV